MITKSSPLLLNALKTNPREQETTVRQRTSGKRRTLFIAFSDLAKDLG
jgi:hypothetical protein